MIDLVRTHVIPAAFRLLPAQMSTPEAARLLLAVGWQESRFTHRVQVGGPARGFWQFELGGGVVGVLGHAKTRDLIRGVLSELGYRQIATPYGCYQAIEHNDVLAAVFARLLLWTHPAPVATTSESGWTQYRETWRPGKPHPETWSQAWTVAN